MKKMNKTVVFILSHNYSGSTWLSLLLGSHSQAFYVGEINKLYSRKYPMPCALCNEIGQECPYFYDVRQVYRREIHHLILERTGKDVLIDNSKRLKWSRHFLGDDRYQHKYIHLIKDPRAMYYSLLSRNRAGDFPKWLQRNAEIDQFLSERRLDKYVLPYNELAENLDASLEEICRWIGLAYEPAQKEYWNFEHHGPGENGATFAFLAKSGATVNRFDDRFYTGKRKTNFVDLRWRENLAADVLRAIEADAKVQRLLADLQMELTETGLRKRA